MTIKICKDCQHLAVGMFCDAPENGISPIDGTPVSRVAVISRNDESLCGSNAEFWKEKVVEVKPWWRFWK